MKVQMNKRLKLTAFEERIHYCYTQSYILLDLYDIYVEFQYVKEDSPAIQFISDKLITPCLEVRILRSVKVKLQTSINDTYLENKDLKRIVPQPDINKPDYYNNNREESKHFYSKKTTFNLLSLLTGLYNKSF